MTLILAMCGFSLAMSISPGPVNIITISSGASYGFIKTIPFVSGATVGFTLLLIATGLGVSELLNYYPLFLNYLVYVGGAFIAYMGVQLIASSNKLALKKAKIPNFKEGFLLQWLNPKAWAACLAGVSAFSTEGSHQTLLVFSSIYFVICYLSIGLWAYAGDKVSVLLEKPIHFRVFNLMMGSGLVVVAIYLIIRSI